MTLAMRVATGGWIERALELRGQTANLSPAERRAFLQGEQEAGRGSVNTLHRQMVAALWLVQRADKYGVKLAEVACAYTSVEALAKLEAARPDNAANVAPDVLLGRITSRQVKNLAAVTKRASPGAPFWPSSWEVFIIDEIGPLLPGGAASIAYDEATWSPTAKLLKVDLEWRYKDGGSAAIFLSPLLLYAQRSSLYETYLAVTAARLHYDAVLFFSYDDEEIRFMEENAPAADRKGAPLRMPRRAVRPGGDPDAE